MILIIPMAIACFFLIFLCTVSRAEGENAGTDKQIGTVRTDAFSMDYLRFGHGEKTFVILPGISIGSIMQYADAVTGAYSLLADDYTIYLFDRRNELPEHYSVYDMALDTAAAIRALGLEQIDLFGASMGGMTAMTLAINEPELVSKLVIGSSAASMGDERYQAIEKWIELAKAGDAEALYLAFGEAIYPQKVFEPARDLLIQSAKGVTEEDLAKFIILAEGIRGFDVTDRLKEIACPTLVIGSEDDQVLGAEASEQIREQLKDRPDCELYMYDGYGHAAYDLAPDYKERIFRFLTGEKTAR